MMYQVLLVALGGAIGASLRHVTGVAALRMIGSTFPWATLLVNVLGSLIMGIVIAWFMKRGELDSTGVKLFLTTGILGGFTTFSAFSLDAVNLFKSGDIHLALGYVFASVIFSIAAVLIGLWFGRAFL